MTHAEMDELYDLYALGVLEAPLANEIARHLNDGCVYCTDHVSSSLALVANLSAIAEPARLPRHLRARVLASFGRRRGAQPGVFVLTAACIGLALISVFFAFDIVRLRNRVGSVSYERDQLRSAVQVLSRRDTRTVEFGRSDNMPHGRVLVNRNGGLVFVGSQLPPLSASQTFELWLVPPKGNPLAAGLFRPDAAGESVSVSETPVDSRMIAALAVSIEPRSGSVAPTTKPFLIVPLT